MNRILNELNYIYIFYDFNGNLFSTPFICFQCNIKNGRVYIRKKLILSIMTNNNQHNFTSIHETSDIVKIISEIESHMKLI